MIRGSRIFGLVARIFLVGLFSFLALAFTFEIYLRQAGFLDAQPANYPCSTGDPVLNHVFQRNCEGRATAKDLKTAKDVSYKTNSLGYRGHEPIAGKKSIVVVGDSYTEGFGLEEEETFPARLEEALKRAGATEWQVLNGGTLGYSTALYSKYFDRFFLELKPELVILNLDFTDFVDDPYYLEIAEYDSNGVPATFPSRDIFPSWLSAFVYSNGFALPRFLHQEANQWALDKRRDQVLPMMNHLVQKGAPLILQEDLVATRLEGCAKAAEIVARHVFELKRRVETVGGQLILHMYPSGNFVKKYKQRPQNISFVRAWDQKHRKDYSWVCEYKPPMVEVFRALSNRHNMVFFDSFPTIMKYPGKEALFFDGDSHWNESGVRVVAGELAKQLLPHLNSAQKKTK